MKKMQASLIILIMVVSVAVVGWAYTMTTGTPGGVKTMEAQMKLNRAAFLLTSTQSSSMMAGQAAMYMALHENAQAGGINDYDNVQMEDKRYWFCNGNTVPDAAYINYFLSLRTKQLVNVYLQNLNNDTVTVSSTTCVDYSLTQQDITSETRTFSADFFGSKITVSDPTPVTSDNDFTSTITGIPYWMMYNNISSWLTSQVPETEFNIMLCKCIPLACDCNPQPGECTTSNCPKFFECLKEEMDASIELLEDGFERDDVECNYIIDECYMEKGVAEPGGACDETCHAWDDPQLPYINCYQPQAQAIDCSPTNPIQVAGEICLETDVYSFADQCIGNCYDPQEERVSTIITVTCTDRGYNIPTTNFPVPFTYSFKMWNAQRVGGACSGGQIPCTFDTAGDCTCSSGGKTCNNCEILGGGGGGVLIACQNVDCSHLNDNCNNGRCTVDANDQPYCETVPIQNKCHCVNGVWDDNNFDDCGTQ